MSTTTPRARARMAAAVLLTVAAAASAAYAATPLSYTGSWSDGQGHTRKVSFDGGASRGKVSGILNVDSFALSVSGAIATDGSVSGTIRRGDGSQAATFTARPGRDGVLAGTVTYGGMARPWSAPGVVLPTATAP
jgi:hypothetical protein